MSNTRSNNPRLTLRGKGNRNPDNWTRGWEIGVLYDCARRGVEYSKVAEVLPYTNVPETSYNMHIETAKRFEQLRHQAIAMGHPTSQASSAERLYVERACATTECRMRNNDEITDCFDAVGITF